MVEHSAAKAAVSNRTEASGYIHGATIRVDGGITGTANP
jgi:hypothetical protein